MYGPVLYYDYTLHVLLLVTHTHLAVATILNTVSGQLSCQTYPRQDTVSDK